jgi:aldose sugar dehydrogenase
MQTIYLLEILTMAICIIFEVNDNTTGLHFGTSVKNDDSKSDAQAGLQDLVADNSDELSAITFGTNFGRITDIETVTDELLYILSYEDGMIYRIINEKH